LFAAGCFAVLKKWIFSETSRIFWEICRYLRKIWRSMRKNPSFKTLCVRPPYGFHTSSEAKPTKKHIKNKHPTEVGCFP
jgi:hypothetical protein